MKQVAIIGGGPAGLMAADSLSASGHGVTVYDGMPSVGRKFLMAGRGGLNLTHSEDISQFVSRYGAMAKWLIPVIEHFPPQALRDWCHDLGQETFLGTSGRVFPKSLKASPLLRALLRRLNDRGVVFSLGHKWLGWKGSELVFQKADGTQVHIYADATLLALGGASWPRLGSDGSWAGILGKEGIALTPLAPANCGFVVEWSDIFRERYQGQPLKTVVLSFAGDSLQGEAMITSQGIEGSAIYAFSSRLRDAITASGAVTVKLDLRPGLSRDDLVNQLQATAGSKSFTTYLRKSAGLSPVVIGLLYEAMLAEKLKTLSPQELATLIKDYPLSLVAPESIDRAISTAGGIWRGELDAHFMLEKKPGVFAAGEMLDWEAPTGGYLLQATFSTAVVAAHGMAKWLATPV